MRGYVIKSYLRPDLFDIFRNSHRLQCTHCARCDFQNLLKNIRLYDPKNLRNALLGFSKFVVCFRVLTRRFSFNAFKPSAEGSGRGEIHFCCNRRKGGITRGEHNPGLKHSGMFYPFHDALTADTLYDRHKIMWRDAKLVGIETDLTLCTCVATYQYLELMEYFFATNAW